MFSRASSFVANDSQAVRRFASDETEIRAQMRVGSEGKENKYGT
jgi:hypothetical protein